MFRLHKLLLFLVLLATSGESHCPYNRIAADKTKRRNDTAERARLAAGAERRRARKATSYADESSDNSGEDSGKEAYLSSQQRRNEKVAAKRKVNRNGEDVSRKRKPSSANKNSASMKRGRPANTALKNSDPIQENSVMTAPKRRGRKPNTAPVVVEDVVMDDIHGPATMEDVLIATMPVNPVENDVNELQMDDLALVTPQRTRRTRNLSHLAAVEEDGVDGRRSTDSWKTAKQRVNNNWEERFKEEKGVPRPSTDRVRKYRGNNDEESDTDEDLDDIQEPGVHSPFTLDERECPTCLARIYEDDRSCCQRGRVFIPPQIMMPKELEVLFYEATALAKKFQGKILAYNSMFSFASNQYEKVPSAAFGPQVVKVRGSVNSFPSNALPIDGNEPAFANFYVKGGKDALEDRMKVFHGVDREIMEIIQQTMEKHNEMAQSYYTLGRFMEKAKAANKDPDRVRMKIIDTWKIDKSKLQAHSGVYRKTSQGGDFVCVFYTASIDQQVSLPGLIIYPKKKANRSIQPLFYWDPKVSPLCYALFFPYGEYGYQQHKFIIEEDRNKSYWERYVEYYLEHPEEAKLWETTVSFEEAEKLAEESKKSRPVSEKTPNEAVFPATPTLPNISGRDQFIEEQHELQEPHEREDHDQMSEEIRLDGEAVVTAEIDPSEYLGRVKQAEVEAEEIVDYGMTTEELQMDDDDVFRDPEPDRDDGNMIEELDDNLDNVVFSDSDGELGCGEMEDLMTGGMASEPEEEDEEGSPAEPKKIQNKGKRKFATRREYEVYNYQERRHRKNRWIHGRKLSQLYLIHTLTQIQQQRTNVWRMKNMEYYNSTKGKFLRSLNNAAKRHGKLIGCLSSVPSSFPGSPRWLYKQFLNAVVMCNKLGKCDLFITATTNVNWPEIKQKLLPGQTWADRPFLVNQVFNEKLKKFLDVILGEKNHRTGKRAKKGIFGRVKWYTYSVEFQQRGPPHAHLVFSLKRKIKTTEQIEKVCQAELSDDPKLKELVEEFMAHRPCEGDPTAYCREKLVNKNQKKCAKGFPKEYCDTTKAGDRHYPELKRRHDGRCSSKDPNVDNRYIVPYNSTLLSLWRGHINVEVISSLRVVKYLFKYLFKGFDRALVEAVVTADNLDVSEMTVDGHLIYPKQLKFPKGLLKRRQQEAVKLLKDRGIPLQDENGQKTLVYDEFVYIQDMRALTSCEAAWDMAAYPRHGASHTVFEQPVHEEDEEPLRFKDGQQDEVAERIKDNDVPTPLKAWFKLNETDPTARGFNYGDISVHYTYKNGKWLQKKRVPKNTLGTVATVSPRRRELFAIRLLALARKGVTSFQDLRTVDAVEYPTFVDAAKRLGLMNDQNEWEECLREATGRLHPTQMRRLFAQILTCNPVEDPKSLWLKIKGLLFEDNRNWDEEMLEAHALHHIASFLSSHGKNLADFNLPEINKVHLPADRDLVTDVYRVPQEKYVEKAPKLVQKLNPDQKQHFETIVGSITKNEDDNTFFIQGSGGTGKTALIKAVYYSLMAAGKKVACVAHTGSAATLLPAGTTAHRLFSIPLVVEEGMHCKIEMESGNADNLSQLDAVIWDEATMTDWRIAEAVHHFFYRLTSQPGRLFGGVAFVFSGDWKQTLPIIPGVRSVGILDYTLLKWNHWPKIKILTLTRNMRAAQDEEFAKLLEEIGRGSINIVSSSRRPEDEVIDLTLLEKKKCLAFSPNEVIKRIFGAMGTPSEKFKFFEKSAILTVDNKSMAEFNERCLKDLLDTPVRTYLSVDEYDDKTGFPALDPESYHRNTPPGMPPHQLNLKKGVVVMLLRNVSVDLGLSNGTRMIVEEMDDKVIYCRPLNNTKHGSDVIGLSRVLFAPSNALTRDVAFKRTQFPVRLAFCITCNKAQGQTLGKVGLILRTPCFAHGQLYVGLSRARSFADLVIYNASKEFLFTNNVVHREVFQLLERNGHQPNTVLDNIQPTTRRPSIPFESSSEDEIELPHQSLKTPPPVRMTVINKEIIGRNSGSTLAVEKVFSNFPSSFPCGFKNLGNTCYGNSVIQALFKMWRREIEEFDGEGDENGVIGALNSTIGMSSPKNAKYLLQLEAMPSMYRDFSKQQSAAECLSHVFDRLPPLFYAQLVHISRRSISCSQCGARRQIGQDESQSLLNIVGELDEYGTFTEYIHSVLVPDQVTQDCEICHVMNAEHQLETEIVIPDFCRFLAVEMGLFSSENGRVYRRNRDIGNPNRVENLFGIPFKPVAAIWHRGQTPTAGHYMAYVENDGEWIECNDSSIRRTALPRNMEGISVVIFERIDGAETIGMAEQEGLNNRLEISGTNQSPMSSLSVSTNGEKELILQKKSIIDVAAEVIVNAANAQLHHGDGVDGIIRAACGPMEINEETTKICEGLPNKQLSPGQVVWTSSCQLQRYKKIYHTAAPIITPGKKPTRSQEDHLRRCYFNSLLLADQDGFKSIGFPLLGIGIYGYDEEQGMAVALQAIFAFFECFPSTTLEKVYVVAISTSIVSRLQRLAGGTHLPMDTQGASWSRSKLEKKLAKRRANCQLPVANLQVASFV